MKKLILASASPRRQDLMNQIGLPFRVMVSNVSEDITQELLPEDLVEKLAILKARDVAKDIKEGIVIGADTIVVNKGNVLGKPSSPKQAVEMLEQLSSTTHQVITGVAVIEKESGKEVVFHETTQVSFKELTTGQIDRYVATGEPLDKAGAYAIQGLGAIMVEGIQGCYFNVVGLPLARLAKELKKLGVEVL